MNPVLIAAGATTLWVFGRWKTKLKDGAPFGAFLFWLVVTNVLPIFFGLLAILWGLGL